MYAIVLGFDEQSGFSELVYKRYMKLWPECPFVFRIPINSEKKNKSYKYFNKQKNIELIRAKKPIRATIEALIEGLPDEEWVYWCIDDRYPVAVKNKEYLNRLANSLCNSNTFLDYDGIKVYRWREEALYPERQKVNLLGLRYFEQKTLKWGFWHHYFCRVRFLKNIFVNIHLPHNYGLRGLQHMITKNGDSCARILVPDSADSVLFAEPCHLGKITKNGLKELKKNNCEIPNYKIFNQNISFDDRTQPKIKVGG